MIVTIQRHGEAGHASTDAERQLTAKGLNDIKLGSVKLRDSCDARSLTTPSLILYSAWARTTQTAELLANAFPEAALRFEASLLPGGSVATVSQSLAAWGDQYDNDAHILLVSHQPLVSYLADTYLGFPHSAPSLCPGGRLTLHMDIPAEGWGSLLFWAFPPEYEASL